VTPRRGSQASKSRHSRPSSVSGRESGGHRTSHHPRTGLHAGLISAPQNDLRHTLHVGYDGAVFGDMSSIGQDHLLQQTLITGRLVCVKLSPTASDHRLNTEQ